MEGVAGGGDVVAGRAEDDVASKLEEELKELEAAVQTILGERRLQQQLRERIVECLDELLGGELAAGDEEAKIADLAETQQKILNLLQEKPKNRFFQS